MKIFIKSYKNYFNRQPFRRTNEHNDQTSEKRKIISKEKQSGEDETLVGFFLALRLILSIAMVTFDNRSIISIHYSVTKFPFSGN